MATRRSKLGWQAATQFTGRTTEWRRVRGLGAGTGGLTSCEALWMGVPIITWPQSQVVSRQTFTFLSAIGLAELAAQDRDDYLRIAVELAADSARLAALRSGMRRRMQASPLMDVAGFTRQLENTLHQLYAGMAEKETLRYAP